MRRQAYGIMRLANTVPAAARGKKIRSPAGELRKKWLFLYPLTAPAMKLS